MAQIYLARQSGLGAFERHVVLKTILRERASDERFVTMFLDEAKLAATLNHQNVAQVYEVDQADGAYFRAMEYVHGENARAILEHTLRRGWTIPLELALMIISGAAAGLHHAHERKGKQGQPLNIVHRDISPANIMVGFDGSVKVLDFGIAKAEERATKTVGGMIKGKYGYMSPEQCKGKPIDRRSDIFALGICLYELTTLRRAFKGKDDFETMKRIVGGDVVAPSVAVPGYPRELEAIILTALANDPNARFQTAQEMIEAMDAFATRSKLAASPNALGRFMTQLFGSKREPWVTDAADRTDITETTPSGHSESEGEKTLLVTDGSLERLAQSTEMPAVTPEGTGTHQRSTRAPTSAETDPLIPVVQTAEEPVHQRFEAITTPVRATRPDATPAPAPVPKLAEPIARLPSDISVKLGRGRLILIALIIVLGLGVGLAIAKFTSG
jgi:eukaryotic-like serine/threonine-protein kinase